MANRWNIPPKMEAEIRARDRACVYCGVAFGDDGARAAQRPSWEHIVNDATIITPENIALCCRGCSGSKGRKRLSDWLASPICAQRDTTRHPRLASTALDPAP